MKKAIKTIAALLIISTAFTACTEEPTTPVTAVDTTPNYSIVKENRALIAESSATWCSPCISFGIPANKEIINTFGNEITNIVMFGTDN